MDDVEAIKALRARDAAACIAGDFRTLRGVMSDDAVVLALGEAPHAGKAALDEAFERMARMPRTHEVIEYRFELSEPEIVGHVAIEYGAIVGSTRRLPDGEVTHSRYNVLRVLRKEADGEWRVYRTLWSDAGH